jgi:hypothetical protein
MGVEDFHDMIESLHVSDLKAGGIDGKGQLRGADAIAMGTVNLGERIDFAQLAGINFKAPHLLFPVCVRYSVHCLTSSFSQLALTSRPLLPSCIQLFHIQFSLRSMTGGEQFWIDQTEVCWKKKAFRNDAADRLRFAAADKLRRVLMEEFARFDCCSCAFWTLWNFVSHPKPEPLHEIEGGLLSWRWPDLDLIYILLSVQDPKSAQWTRDLLTP